MEADVTFGSWLRRRRRALDLTQQELADCAGCSIVTIRKFESDERRPSKQLAELLADCLDIPPEEQEQFLRFARRAETAPPEPPPAVASPAPPQPLAIRSVRDNLPASLTGLVGRETDIESLVALLQEPDVRLVSLTGPGGTGKTRLAIAAARHLKETCPDLVADGVFFVDLSTVGEPEDVVPATARTLDVPEKPDLTLAEAIERHVRDWRALLVFDNFEHVLDAAGELLNWLSAAAGLKLLTTTRQLLGLYGEHEIPVSPLALPEEAAGDVSTIQASPAVTLFVARSRAADAAFRLTPDNAAPVLAICRRLEGLPLAIELAAARSKQFDPPALLARLDSSLDLGGQLRPGPRFGRDRQLTLRQAIDWSYRLLTPAEQRLFRLAGVFSGSFGAADFASVAGQQREADAARAIDPLVAANMIRHDRSDDRPYRLLFVLREFALEQLEQSGELEDARQRHFTHFEALATTAASSAANDLTPARTLLRPAIDDLRAALDWSLDTPEWAERGLQLAIMLAQTDYWIENNMMAEGMARLDQGLSASEAGPGLRAAALVSAGRLAYYRVRLHEAVALGEEALDLLDAQGAAADENWQIIARRVVANAAGNLGDIDRLYAYQQENIAAYRRLNDPIGEANALQSIGITTTLNGDYAKGETHLAEAVDLLRRHGDRADLLLALNALGLTYLVAGDYARAERPLQEALALAVELDIKMWQSMILGNIGHLLVPSARYEEARNYFEEAGKLAREAGSPQYAFQASIGLATLGLLEAKPSATVWAQLADCLNFFDEEGRLPSRFERLADVLALYWAREGRPDLAARLMARGEAIRAEHRLPHFANVRFVHERALALIGQRLENSQQEACFAQGRAESIPSLLAAVAQANRSVAS